MITANQIIQRLRAAVPRERSEPAPADDQRARYAEKLQRSIDMLGNRWLLHPDCPAHYQCPDRMRAKS